jgi:hypothetical protein
MKMQDLIKFNDYYKVYDSKQDLAGYMVWINGYKFINKVDWDTLPVDQLYSKYKGVDNG